MNTPNTATAKECTTPVGIISGSCMPEILVEALSVDRDEIYEMQTALECVCDQLVPQRQSDDLSCVNRLALLMTVLLRQHGAVLARVTKIWANGEEPSTQGAILDQEKPE